MKKLTYILAFSVFAFGISAQVKKSTVGGKTTTTGTTTPVSEIGSEKELTGFLSNSFSATDNIVYYDLTDALNHPDEVTSLKLNRQGLTEIPKELSKFKNLTELDLSSNEITDFSSKLNDLSNLKVLNLSGNKLTTIPTDICSLKNLVSLNLSSNKIASGSISCSAKLERLYLNSNQLTQLPDGTTELKGLKALHVQFNQIASLDEKLLKLTDLEVLIVKYNKIVEEPTQFQHNGILNYVFYPQAVNTKYIFNSLKPKGSLTSYVGQTHDGSNNVDESVNTFGSEEIVVNEKYNIKSVAAGNDFRRIKIGDHDYRRYSKARVYVLIPVLLCIPYIDLFPAFHLAFSKRHRNNLRMSLVYYKQQRVDKIISKTPTIKSYKKVTRINKRIVRKYAKYLRSNRLIAK